MGKIYPEYKQLDLSAIGKDILDWWEKEKIFEKSISSREGKKPYVFYEGPPSANGMPGIHHVMSRTIKDIFCRYHTLKGEKVNRKGGWDTHGLPIELSVEKTLGIRKDDIGKKISVEDYNKACRKEVMKYKEVWDDLTRKMGYWVDLDHPYITFENNYIETCWWLLKELYKKNLLYKGYTIQPYSPAAGTGLSSHELNQPGTYRPIKDTSIVAQFRVTIMPGWHTTIFPPGSNELFFIAWTTTPWTLPANCALAVGEKIKYSFVRTFNSYTFKPITVILATELIGRYFSEKNVELKLEDYKQGDKAIPFKVIGEVIGKDLKGIKYEQLMPYVQPNGKAFEVIIGDFVTTEEGTGVVHTASVFGADDFRVCNENGIASVLVKDENGNDSPLVDKRGRFVKEVTDFAGEYVKEQYLTDAEKEEERKKQGGEKYLSVDERISIKLKKENKAFKVEKYEHNYPHCWRTDKPILYYPLDSWFVRTTACKQRMIELNNTINWKPESTGTGRFGNWLENLVDWNLSRSRFWGIPLPIWRTEDGKEEVCIGSVEELKKMAEPSSLASEESHDFDLHKPYIDDIVLISPSGKKMTRESDLIDVWFDSGSMPYAQWHYPFENKETFQKNFPADFIAEGVDQTRGWFFTLHAIASMVFDSVAFKNVVSNGLVLDKNGNKMSKRLGNAADPFETINKYGPDAVRWYMVTNASPWDNLKFDMEGIAEKQRSFFGTLYNTYSFFALYANIDGFVISDNKTPYEKRGELDQWILSCLHSLIEEVTHYYDNYDPTPAGRAIENFVDEHLSNWYIRLSRRRFWKGEMSDDKKIAYETLYECLTTVAQLMSPIAPFFAEWLYRNLIPQKGDSVHLTYLLKADKKIINKELEEKMDLAQKISSMILSIRKKENLRVRQPLQRIQIPVLDNSFKEKVEAMKDLILSEVNVKQLEFVDEKTTSIIKNLKLNFKTLGKKYGKLMKGIQEHAANHSAAIIGAIEKNGSYEATLGYENVILSTEDVEIIPVDMPGWKVANNGSITVALDVTLSPELRDEGLAREFVNRIQNLRKDKGYEVTDKIALSVLSHEEIKNSLINNKDYICAEILATSLEIVDSMQSPEAVTVVVDDNISTLVTIDKN